MCMMGPYNCRFWVWNFLHVTPLAPIIIKWHIGFWQICATLLNATPANARGILEIIPSIQMQHSADSPPIHQILCVWKWCMCMYSTCHTIMLNQPMPPVSLLMPFIMWHCHVTRYDYYCTSHNKMCHRTCHNFSQDNA
jgi:hypothetical protein